MIPQSFITHWAANAPWPTMDQVEQDLLLSRLIVEIANDPYLGDELVFRGGTCLHKLRMSPALRYSEDLDYVRKSGGPIKPMLDALHSLGERLGMHVRVDVSKFPKVKFRAPFESGSGSMRIKIEVNTYERSPAQPLELISFAVKSPWFSGDADVLTFSTAELVATKIRALYQRSKGRDLFDMWLALTRLGVTGNELLKAFPPYRPEGLTSALAISNLCAKVARPDFRQDLLPLLAALPSEYDVEAAKQIVIDAVLSYL